MRVLLFDDTKASGRIALCMLFMLVLVGCDKLSNDANQSAEPETEEFPIGIYPILLEQESQAGGCDIATDIPQDAWQGSHFAFNQSLGKVWGRYCDGTSTDCAAVGISEVGSFSGEEKLPLSVRANVNFTGETAQNCLVSYTTVEIAEKDLFLTINSKTYEFDGDISSVKSECDPSADALNTDFSTLSPKCSHASRVVLAFKDGAEEKSLDEFSNSTDPASVDETEGSSDAGESSGATTIDCGISSDGELATAAFKACVAKGNFFMREKDAPTQGVCTDMHLASFKCSAEQILSMLSQNDRTAMHNAIDKNADAGFAIDQCLYCGDDVESVYCQGPAASGQLISVLFASDTSIKSVSTRVSSYTQEKTQCTVDL